MKESIFFFTLILLFLLPINCKSQNVYLRSEVNRLDAKKIKVRNYREEQKPFMRPSNFLTEKELEKIEDFNYFKLPFPQTLSCANSHILVLDYEQSVSCLDQYILEGDKKSSNYESAIKLRSHMRENLGYNDEKDVVPYYKSKVGRAEAKRQYKQLILKAKREEDTLKFNNRIKEIRNLGLNIDSYLPDMIGVPSGKLKINCRKLETCITVNVSSFMLSKFEITEEQWSFIMDDDNLLPSKNSTSSFPIIGISRNKISEFLSRLNLLTGKNYRLPSNLEWEFVARPNMDDPEYWGNVQRKNSNQKTNEVGSYRANKYGFFDLYGNVSEWVEECYDPRNRGRISTSADGTPCWSGKYLFRGGNFGLGGVAANFSGAASINTDRIGFRPAF